MHERVESGHADAEPRVGVTAARAIALAWGFAEATLFFVIPDVWLTFLALRSTREGLAACAYAVAGAVCGGALIRGYARHDQEAVLAVFDQIPAIGPELIGRVHTQLDALGGWAVMIGPFTGLPYKLYAAMSASAGLGLAEFLTISVPARGLRFVLLTLVAGLAARWATPRFGARRVRLVWLALWVLNYALYWALVPN